MQPMSTYIIILLYSLNTIDVKQKLCIKEQQLFISMLVNTLHNVIVENSIFLFASQLKMVIQIKPERNKFNNSGISFINSYKSILLTHFRLLYLQTNWVLDEFLSNCLKDFCRFDVLHVLYIGKRYCLLHG